MGLDEYDVRLLHFTDHEHFSILFLSLLSNYIPDMICHFATSSVYCLLCQVTALSPDGLVARSGSLPNPKVTSVTEGRVLVNWALVEINGCHVQYGATKSEVRQ